MSKNTKVPNHGAEDQASSATNSEDLKRVSREKIRLLKLTERGARERIATAEKGIKRVDADLSRKGLGAARRAILFQERQDFQDDLACADATGFKPHDRLQTQ